MGLGRFDGLIETAHRSRPTVPVPVIQAVIATESSFRPDAYREEPGGDGSIGLMQLRLSTARGLGYTGTKERLFDPAINIAYGVKLLAEIEQRIRDATGRAQDWPAVVSAYNGGFRPSLGFGARVSEPVTVCIARHPSGDCERTYTAKPGQFGNQLHVDRFERWYSQYSPGGGTRFLAPLAIALGVGAILGIKT